MSRFSRAIVPALSTCCLLHTAYTVAAPTITALSNVVVNQHDMATIIDPDITMTNGGSYADGSIRFSLAGSTANDNFSLSNVSLPDDADVNALDAISVEGTLVYLGDGTSRHRIGVIDAIENGRDGAALKVLFSFPLVNASFENGTTSGWTVFESQYPNEAHLHGDSIPWVRRADSTGGTGTINIATTASLYYSVSIVTSPNSSGAYGMRLFSSGSVGCTNAGGASASSFNGFCSSHGPWVESSPFSGSSGDQIFTDWSAENGQDAYEVQGHLVGDGPDNTFGTSDDTEALLFSQRGDTKIFSVSSANITAEDTYKFRFVSGSYDASGGAALGASLYVDNVRLVSSTPVTDTVVQNIARLVTFDNTSESPPHQARNLTVTATGAGGTSGSATSTITIASNVAPSISSTAITRATQGSLYTYSVTGIDSDPDAVLTYRLTTAPEFLSMGTATGLISGTPTPSDLGDHLVTVRVSDGSLSADQSYTLSVLADLDQDGTPDIEDTDIDGDGMPNAWETEHALNSHQAGDAAEDKDQDGLNNLGEYQQSKNPHIDDNPPVVTAPVDLVVNATELFTTVNLEIASAHDAKDGALTVSASRSGRFEPGRHEIIWSATDTAGNTGTAIQVLKVKPLVEFSHDQQIGEAGSPEVVVSVHLNGQAADYPVTVPFAVTGTALNPDDHNLLAGTFVITSGLQASIAFNVVDDGAGDDSETITLSMHSPTHAVIGSKRLHNIFLSEGNKAPKVSLKVLQASDNNTSIVISGGGEVLVPATVQDPNVLDSHTYDWSRSDPRLIDLDTHDNAFRFDPSLLEEGVYTLRLNTSDSGNPPLASTKNVKFRVQARPPILNVGADTDGDSENDRDEGFADNDQDGVPNYLDATLATNVIEEQQAKAYKFLMETNAGLRIRLGATAIGASKGTSKLEKADIMSLTGTPEDTIENTGGYFDFDVTDLPVPGQTIEIVVAQFNQLPEQPVYRALTNVGGWQSFIENGTDHLASAAGDAGYCPPPGDRAYTAGLTPGHWCVQLTLQEGGANDDDQERNGTVVNLGGVGTKIPTPPRLSGEEGGGGGAGGGGGGGGGGTVSYWMLLITLMLRFRKSPPSNMLAVMHPIDATKNF